MSIASVQQRKALQVWERVRIFYRHLPSFRKRLYWAPKGLVFALAGYLVDPWPNAIARFRVCGAPAALDCYVQASVGHWTEFVALVLGLYGFADAIWSIINIFVDISAFSDVEKTALKTVKVRHINVNDHIFEFPQLRPSLDEAEAGFQVRIAKQVGSETYLRSEAYDCRLGYLTTWPFELEASRVDRLFDSAPPVRHKQIAYLVPKLLNTGLATVNEMKMGMRFRTTEPDFDVGVYQVGYFDSMVTNEAFRSQTVTASTDKSRRPSLNTDLTAHFPAQFVGGEAHILPLSECLYLGNHVGITVLTLTEDDHVVCMRQATQTMMSADSVSLGGSGSADWEDIECAREPESLISIIAYAMARELYEEARLSPQMFAMVEKPDAVRKLADSVIVTGFFRWVDRCGKPEFVGVLRLPFLLAQLSYEKMEVRRIFLDLPVVRTMSDFVGFRHALEHCLATDGYKHLSVSTGSWVALERIIEIAGYAASSDRLQKKYFKRMSNALFPLKPSRKSAPGRA